MALPSMQQLQAFLERFKLDQELIRLDEIAAQKRVAAVLRKAAIDHLRKGKEVVARSFRGEYLASGLGHFEPFLKEQARDGAWGTYIEATALAEMMGCHLVVTPVKSGVPQEPICLYRAANENAPKIELFNSNNTHWYVNNKTLGDGNCLFNALTQAVQEKIRVKPLPVKTFAVEAPTVKVPASELPVVKAKTPSLAGKPSEVGLFNQVNQEAQTIAEHQQAILDAILKQPTPSELKAQSQRETERIARLPLPEQKQIAEDYQMALRLAKEEGSYSGSFNIYQPLQKAYQTQQQVVLPVGKRA